ANQSIMDVLTLTNMLVDLENNNVPEIETIFQEYQRLREPVSRSVFQMSNRFGHLMNRKGWFNDLVRKACLQHTPRWLVRFAYDKISQDRPQAVFLPFVEHGGTCPAKPQKRSAYVPFLLEP
ncbi:hypothetical protein BGZ46_002736, partial [Entomortierella lignicola]